LERLACIEKLLEDTLLLKPDGAMTVAPFDNRGSQERVLGCLKADLAVL
jgi:hypothetical protein